MSRRLIAITTIVIIAFAGNSLLNRAALEGGYADPMGFTYLRVLFGSFALWALLTLQNKQLPRIRTPNWFGIAGLSAYLLGFSFAYLNLDTGLGALILFGCVQITMFAWVLVRGQAVSLVRWIGTLIGLTGLIFMVWPTQAVALDVFAVVCMLVAGIGWGVFSIVGIRSTPALETASLSFLFSALVLSVPFVVLLGQFAVTWQGLGLAALSGAITSGMGYALWYSILPQLGAARAAIVQVTVPAVAAIMGVVFLSESISLKLIVAGTLILGGTVIALWSHGRRPKEVNNALQK